MPSATSVKDIFVGSLAMVLTVGFFAFIAALFKVPIPEANKDIVMLAGGILFGGATMAWGYYFGSSQSSKDKTQIIANNLEERKTS